MESVRQSCRPKHQVLTLKCYPKYQKGVSDVKPNPSELSYLLYYASTRRSKLTKVGAFLEKRVAKDVWRRRFGNVQVALHILTALIEKVPRDLPIYAQSVLTVIESVLGSNEISMVEESIETFETFCRHQDIATIAAEQGISNKYRDIVRTYSSFADPSSENCSPSKLSPPVAIRWRNAGLRAIKSVVGSESLAIDGGNCLKIILPVILENLYSPNEDVIIPLKERLAEIEKEEREVTSVNFNRRTSVVTVDSPEGDPTLAAQPTAAADHQAEIDARVLALRCLEQIIVSGSNRGQIRIAASTILRFISGKRLPPTTSNENSENWATSLVGLIANWCPVQVRFIILVTAIDILLETNPKEDSLDPAFTILTVADWLVKSSVNMIGLSVMDILLGLMNYVAKILSPDSEKQHGSEASGKRKMLLGLLEQCIGDLATHTYYGDQVSDMMRAILRHFKPPVTLDSAAPSTLATVHETKAAPITPVTPVQSNADSPWDSLHVEAFSSTASKLTFLRAVKAILLVANSKRSATSEDPETKNPVGIHVWEGTHVLIRDASREVRFAYVDAFLVWLQLETHKRDLHVQVETPKYIKSSSKRDPEQVRRGTSSAGNQKEKVTMVAQSRFLRLLHLAIYDSVLETATSESDILLLHLLLTSLINNLGVNALQFGLPMILKLQEDVSSSVDLGYAARVNVGSLVHGYLLAVSEKFNLTSTNAGIDIQKEIEKRQSNDQWLTNIQSPPIEISGISIEDYNTPRYDSKQSILTPFRNLEGLVNGIDESYSQNLTTPPHSPQATLAQGFSFPVLSNSMAELQPQAESGLPSSAKEQMLSSWSREACIAAVEKESFKALSISGSRAGTVARNSNTNGAPTISPAGSDRNRRMSVPELAPTSDNPSTRGSPVRVTELRRVLSVNTENPARRLSPLRGRLDASNMSMISSGSDSMVSGYSASEMDPDAASIKPQENEPLVNGEGVRASDIALTGDSSPYPTEDIPPVPPIPAGLAIPGSFPADSQRSLLIDRPSTAPDNSFQASLGKSSDLSQHGRKKSLNRTKSRSSNTLAADAQESNGESFEPVQRDELKKFLNGYRSSSSPLAYVSRPTTSASAKSGFPTGRRASGIGRPPY